MSDDRHFNRRTVLGFSSGIGMTALSAPLNPIDTTSTIRRLSSSSNAEQLLATNASAIGAVFNVRSFGARGNGMLDDTVAIQHCVDFARSVAERTDCMSVVAFPTGHYLTGTIVIPAYVSIRGEGVDSTVILGKPGEDVFAYWDLSVPDHDFKALHGHFIEQLSILVDCSVDAYPSYRRTTHNGYRVGNCGIAIPCSGSPKETNNRMYGTRFKTLRITRNNQLAHTQHSNNTCGIFDQAGLYGKIVDDVYITYLTYGFLEGMFAAKEIRRIDTSSSRLWCQDHGYTTTDEVALIGRKYVDSAPEPLRYRVKYYVVNPTSDSFQLAKTKNGDALRLQDSGSGDLWVAIAGHSWKDDYCTDQSYFNNLSINVPKNGLGISITNTNSAFFSNPSINYGGACIQILSYPGNTRSQASGIVVNGLVSEGPNDRSFSGCVFLLEMNDSSFNTTPDIGGGNSSQFGIIDGDRNVFGNVIMAHNENSQIRLLGRNNTLNSMWPGVPVSGMTVDGAGHNGIIDNGNGNIIRFTNSYEGGNVDAAAFETSPWSITDRGGYKGDWIFTNPTNFFFSRSMLFMPGIVLFGGVSGSGNKLIYVSDTEDKDLPHPIYCHIQASDHANSFTLTSVNGSNRQPIKINKHFPATLCRIYFMARCSLPSNIEVYAYKTGSETKSFGRKIVHFSEKWSVHYIECDFSHEPLNFDNYSLVSLGPIDREATRDLAWICVVPYREIMLLESVTSKAGPSIYWGQAPPTSGAYKVGDRIFNTVPAVGHPKSWVCVTANPAPGTWVSEGNL
jgi:hypothetical protein